MKNESLKSTIITVIIIICFFPKCFCSDFQINDFCNNCSAYIDQYQESCIILFDNSRFIAELYYIDDEGGNYEGSYKWEADKLILLSDQINIAIPESCKINSAELNKFVFINDNNKIKLSEIDKFQKNRWCKETLISLEDAKKNNLYPMDSYFGIQKINEIINNPKLDWVHRYIGKSSDTLISNSYWINRTNQFCFEISDLLNIKLYNLNSKKINYGYINYFQSCSHKQNLAYKNADTIEIFYDHIIYNGDFNKTKVEEVKFIKWKMQIRNSKLILLSNEYVSGSLGDELYYNKLNYESNNNFNSDLKKEKCDQQIVFEKVSKSEYDDFIKKVE